MTTFKEILQDIFSRISESFPHVKIEYQFDEVSCTHYIKVTPQEVYDSSEFLLFESKLNNIWNNSDILSKEDFCIVSEESLIQLDSPELIYAPSPRKDVVFIPAINVEETVISDLTVDHFYSFAIDGQLTKFADSFSFYKLAA